MDKDLPLFFAKDILPHDKEYMLDENNSRHCIQVLRRQPGDNILLTDGKGYCYDALIQSADKKNCAVKIINAALKPARKTRLHLGISFTRQSSRNEWLLEKITEIGVNEIHPTICTRTAKEHYKINRLQQIIISAMLQSQQYYLPILHKAVALNTLIQQSTASQKFIAHCLPDEKKYLSGVIQKNKEALILIGPEGDFTKEEIELALQYQFTTVSLGNTRLRTETAAVAACVMMNAGIKNEI